MKNVIKIPLILILGISAINGEDIDTILSKLPTKREGSLPKISILETPSPMPELIVTDQNNTDNGDSNTTLKVKKEHYKLIAIMNDSANINGQWYKVGQKIGSFELTDIMDDAVFLKSPQKEKILFFENRVNKINIKIGR